MIDETTADLVSQALTTDLVTLLAVALVVFGLALLGGMPLAWMLIRAQNRMSGSVMNMATSVGQMAQALSKKVEEDSEQTKTLGVMAASNADKIAALKGVRDAVDAQAPVLQVVGGKVDQLLSTHTRLIATLKPIAQTIIGLENQIAQIKQVGGSMAQSAAEMESHVREIKTILRDTVIAGKDAPPNA